MKRVERILVALRKSDSNKFERSYTLLCWKCRMLRPQMAASLKLRGKKTLTSLQLLWNSSNDKEMLVLSDCKWIYIIHIYIMCEQAFCTDMIILTAFEVAVGIKLTGQHCVSFPGQVTHLTGHRPRISQRAICIVSALCVLPSGGERTSRLDDLTCFHKARTRLSRRMWKIFEFNTKSKQRHSLFVFKINVAIKK